MNIRTHYALHTTDHIHCRGVMDVWYSNFVGVNWCFCSVVMHCLRSINFIVFIPEICVFAEGFVFCPLFLFRKDYGRTFVVGYAGAVCTAQILSQLGCQHISANKCRDETIAWPHRSPGLTPLDFFFWGFMKNSLRG